MPHVPVLSPPVGAVFPKPAASRAGFPPTPATTVPLVVMPRTAQLQGLPRPLWGSRLVRPAATTAKVLLSALVMAGAWFTVSVKLCVPFGVTPLLAVIVML